MSPSLEHALLDNPHDDKDHCCYFDHEWAGCADYVGTIQETNRAGLWGVSWYCWHGIVAFLSFFVGCLSQLASFAVYWMVQSYYYNKNHPAVTPTTPPYTTGNSAFAVLPVQQEGEWWFRGYCLVNTFVLAVYLVVLCLVSKRIGSLARQEEGFIAPLVPFETTAAAFLVFGVYASLLVTRGWILCDMPLSTTEWNRLFCCVCIHATFYAIVLYMQHREQHHLDANPMKDDDDDMATEIDQQEDDASSTRQSAAFLQYWMA